MQTSGNIETGSAVGNSGTVYTKIPKNGIGQVTININNHLREFEAGSISGDEIASGEIVKVVSLNGNILLVEKLNVAENLNK